MTTLILSPTQTVTIKESSPERLLLEAVYDAGGEAPPKHLHSGQDEFFEVVSGSVRARIDRNDRTLEAGDQIEIPRGAVHQMWNPGSEPAQVAWETKPALRTEDLLRAIDRLYREGRVGGNGMPGPLALAAVANEYRDVFRLAVAPDLLLRPILAALAVAGRARGHLSGARDRRTP